MDLRAVVFDLDDTLVHGVDPRDGRALDLHYLAWCAVLGRHAKTLDRALYLDRMSGQSNEVCETFVRARFGISGPASFSGAKEAHYRENLVPEHLRLREGAAELLTGLAREGIGLGVLTNAPAVNVAAAARVGFDAYFAAEDVIDADALARLGHRPKPAPDGLLYLARRLAIEPDEMLYVGDSVSDLRCGSDAGVAVLAIEANHARATLLARGAIDTFASFLELDVARLRAVPAARR